jgi:Co/Zn/Cd efflux system component
MKTVKTMQKSIFRIAQMDCPSEEQLIRMALGEAEGIVSLEFDIPQRLLTVYHTGSVGPVGARLDALSLGSELHESYATNVSPRRVTDTKHERQLLWQVLAINFFFFVLELVVGIFAKSMGLVSDSLDMLADSLVYGLALMAVGHSVQRKKNVAQVAGWLQISLAILGIFEVLRRFLSREEIPDIGLMVGISALALLGNAACLYLLQKSKSQEAHIQASMIFTSNDVIVNLGVMVSAGLVYGTQSPYPDLIMGSLVFVLVARGARQILRLGR